MTLLLAVAFALPPQPPAFPTFEQLYRLAWAPIEAWRAGPGALRSATSTREQKLAALDRLDAAGEFSSTAAHDLLGFLEREEDPELRRRAARTFYLLFYDTRSRRLEAFQFLIRLGVVARYGALTRDPDLEVRRPLLTTAQVMANGLPADARGEVARRYAGVLVDAVLDPVPELRHEALAALEGLADTRVLDDPVLRRRLARLAEHEKEPDVRERIADLLGDKR